MAGHAGFHAFAGSGGTGASSSPLGTMGLAYVSVFGNINAASSVKIQVSEDGSRWYTAKTISATSGTDFFDGITTGAQYVRVNNGTAFTTGDIFITVNGG